MINTSNNIAFGKMVTLNTSKDMGSKTVTDSIAVDGSNLKLVQGSGFTKNNVYVTSFDKTQTFGKIEGVDLAWAKKEVEEGGCLNLVG